MGDTVVIEPERTPLLKDTVDEISQHPIRVLTIITLAITAFFTTYLLPNPDEAITNPAPVIATTTAYVNTHKPITGDRQPTLQAPRVESNTSPRAHSTDSVTKSNPAESKPSETRPEPTKTQTNPSPTQKIPQTSAAPRPTYTQPPGA